MESIWIIFVFIYALLKGGREGMKKAATKKSSTNEILFFYTLIGLIMVIPFSKTAFDIEPIYIFYSFIKASVCCTAWIFSLMAIKSMSVSLYGIMDLARMVFSTMLGVLVLGESLTGAKIAGMLLVVTGLALVNAKKHSASGTMTLFTLIAVLLNCFFNAVSGVMDKIIMKSIDSNQLQFWFMFFMTIINGAILAVRREKISFASVKTNYWIPLMSLSLILGDRLLFEANANPQSEVTLMTLIKQSSVIVTVLTGRFVFKEKGLLFKLICTAIVITGIMIPLIF